MHAHLGQIMAKKCKRPKISTTTSEELGAKTGCWEQKAGYHAWPLHTASPKGWTNQLGHPSIPLDTPLLSPHLRKKLALPSVSKQRGSLLFALPPAVAGARIKPLFSFLFGLQSISIDWGRPGTLVGINTRNWERQRMILPRALIKSMTLPIP